MASEEKKYERILNILQKSKPELTGQNDIEERVLNGIMQTGKQKHEEFNLFDYLFGWVYIGWLRTSLVTVSVFFITLFIYQQSLILRRINLLENQTVVTGSQFVSRTSVDLDDKIMLNKLSFLQLNTRNITITEKQLEKFIDSYNDLKNKYKDLIQIIENDPELKQMLETKLTEKNKRKFNL